MIKDILGYKIFNSRGEPTVLIKTITDKGVFYGSAPSGASVGRYEAKTLNIDKSLEILKNVKENFIGLREEDYSILEDMIVQFAGDRFQNIGSHLGFALSSSFLKAATLNKPYRYFDEISFPYPVGNVMGGGVHGGGTDIQEFHLIPINAKSFPEAIGICIEGIRRIKDILSKRGKVFGKNDENALVSDLNDEEVFEIVSSVADDLGARIGIDMAATELWDPKKGKYVYKKLGKETTPGEQLDAVKELINLWKVYFVEDPFHEDDFQNFARLRKWRPKILVCGDDIFATNMERVKMGIKYGSCNSMIIKPNQIGTIGLAMEVAEFANRNGMKTVVSHRSGETNDWIVSDLALGLSPFIKTGVWGGERLAKHNRLIEIWNSLPKPRMAKI
ncbi:MAG: enolase [Candidatus Aenigmarchaeota archaeon]|nr:enolase [Candidatus Aenigmarchaeota archaeon]